MSNCKELCEAPVVHLFLPAAQHTGHLLQDSASLLQDSASMLHLQGEDGPGDGGSVLQSGGRVGRHRRKHKPRDDRKLEIGHPNTAVKSRIDDDVANGILEMFSSLLSTATNILTDIAFIKIKILQGLFSNPDCWVTAKNDNNGCISQLCNDTEQRQNIYMDNFGSCSGDQERKWIIDVDPTIECLLNLSLN